MEKPTIAVCLPGGQFTAGFMASWTRMVSEFASRQWPFFVSNYRSADLFNCRNMVALGAREVPKDPVPFEGREYDYMLWIDSDMVFEWGDFERLLEVGCEVACGIYPIDAREAGSCGWLTSEGNHRLSVHEVLEHDEPFVVDYTGFGFVLVKRGVFEKMGFPWFEGRNFVFSDSETLVPASEDVAWALKARETGVEIYAHPGVLLGHQKVTVLRWDNGPASRD